jgi:hypothetical protein
MSHQMSHVRVEGVAAGAKLTEADVKRIRRRTGTNAAPLHNATDLRFRAYRG